MNKLDLTYEEAMKRFIDALTFREKEYVERHLPNLEPETFFVAKGKRYDKVVKHGRGHKGVYCFISRETGGIIKAASWSQPDVKKYERGNIFFEENLSGTNVHGVNYMR